MEGISRNQVVGTQVDLITSDKRHFDGKGNMTQKTGEVTEPFAKMLLGAVDQVNSLQQQSDDMDEKMALYPDQVDVHEVMIASEKARLSVSFFKSVTEKAMRAYNEIMMLR
jgi:flagellar hook-basal body complex protein FliE